MKSKELNNNMKTTLYHMMLVNWSNMLIESTYGNSKC